MRPTEYRAQLRRSLALTLLALGPLASSAFSSPLFDDDSVIEIRLSGPLRTLPGTRSAQNALNIRSC